MLQERPTSLDPTSSDYGTLTSDNNFDRGLNRLTCDRILAVLINSLYSFWWDVTNDWGLSLLTRSGWTKSTSNYSLLPTGPPLHQPSPRLRQQASFSGLANSHGRGRSTAASSSLMIPGDQLAYPPPPSRPMSPATSPSKSYHANLPPSSSARSHHTRAFSTAASPNVTYPFLRPILLLPDPTVYYLAVAVDLVLRFTWSLKLSSHLHSIHEIESGIFLMEALEVVRRWMWVYLRIEWEAVRKGGGGLVISDSEGRLRAEEEMVGGGGGGGYRDGGIMLEEQGDLGGMESSREGSREGSPAPLRGFVDGQR